MSSIRWNSFNGIIYFQYTINPRSILDSPVATDDSRDAGDGLCVECERGNFNSIWVKVISAFMGLKNTLTIDRRMNKYARIQNTHRK